MMFFFLWISSFCFSLKDSFLILKIIVKHKITIYSLLPFCHSNSQSFLSLLCSSFGFGHSVSRKDNVPCLIFSFKEWKKIIKKKRKKRKKMNEGISFFLVVKMIVKYKITFYSLLLFCRSNSQAFLSSFLSFGFDHSFLSEKQILYF